MSADFIPYINLRPLDITPTQIYLDSIEVARTVFPNFDLRPGTIEDAMFQAFAFMSALNIGAINRLPDGLMLGVGQLLGTPYADGTRATMEITLTANSNDGGTIPAGTIVTYNAATDDGETSVSHAFETIEAVTIPSNTLGDPLPTANVAVTARDIGVIPVIPTNTPLTVNSYSQVLYSAKSAGNFVQGSNAETVDEFLSRTVSNLSSMSSALTTTSQLQNYLLVTYPSLVKRCKVYDLTDPEGTLTLAGAPIAGKVTVFAYGPERNLTNTEITELENDIAEKSVAGLEIGIVNPYLLNFRIQATVSYYSIFEAANVEELIKQNLINQFSPTYSQWTEEKLRYNDVLRAIYANPSVHSVESLTLSTQYTGVAVSGATASGGNVTYTSVGHPFSVGDLVAVTGITPSSLNTTTPTAVISRTNNTFVLANGAASGTYVSGGTSAGSSPYWGSVSGNDINYTYKGSLLNLQLEKISLTLNSFTI